MRQMQPRRAVTPRVGALAVAAVRNVPYGGRGRSWHSRTQAGAAPATMPLYIGKNHSDKDNTPVQSIFRLSGRGEDALTFALGYLLAHDARLCAALVRLCGAAPARSIGPDYSIHLQEVTGKGFGRRDIVIEAPGTRIVIEAKIGGAAPSLEQLLKYCDEKRLWEPHATRAVVALTEAALPPAKVDCFSSRLSEEGICFRSVQWHRVIELVLRHRPSDDSEVARFLLDEFSRFARREYRMNFFDAEILVQDLNPENAEIFERGWVYVTHLTDKKAPLYFAPYFVRRGAGTGISVVSRLVDSKVLKLAEAEDVPWASGPDQMERWRVGMELLRKHAEKHGFLHSRVRVHFLDRPVTLLATPMTKRKFKEAGPDKKIPRTIPKGFSLRFQDVLAAASKAGES